LSHPPDTTNLCSEAWIDQVEDLQIEESEDRLTEIERQIAGLRAEQADMIRHLDQIDTADGARTMGDWVPSRLVAPDLVPLDDSGSRRRR
jgi:hypothetical protein